MLHALARHIGVVRHGSANAVDFVGGDAGAGAGATDQDDPLCLPGSDQFDRTACHIGEVHRLFGRRTKADHPVTMGSHDVVHVTLHGKAGVVRGQSQRGAARDHKPPTLLLSLA